MLIFSISLVFLTDILQADALDFRFYKSFHMFNTVIQEKCAVSRGSSDAELVPIYASIAHAYSELAQYGQACVYFNKELGCRAGDPVQVESFLSFTGFFHLLIFTVVFYYQEKYSV